MSDAAAADARHIALVGGQNFREVAGYATQDGRRVRGKTLYRSAMLSALEGGDVCIINGLGLKVIADLRDDRERAWHPSVPAILSGREVLTWEGGDVERLQSVAFPANATQGDVFDYVLAAYRKLPDRYAGHMATLYRKIADGGTPVLIHCAAGKDRTGVVVGVLLELLGVSRHEVLADYARTQALLDWDKLTANAAGGIGFDLTALNTLPPGARRTLFSADPKFLKAALEQIERDHGTIRGFAAERLALSQSDLAHLEHVLLEEA